ncbi:putative disease resistance protein RGA3 [Magnolia sinica]|uniref:putative disease resistance protein RGA3 n=1 Tax=Magnolia sinica TaxID=86752 RepID=UPI00265A44D3|nr:putative disease resistance protein RGA3 [Magnolia sinica]
MLFDTLVALSTLVTFANMFTKLNEVKKVTNLVVSKQVLRSFPSPTNCFKHVVLRQKIGSRIKEARKRLAFIAEEKSQLGLRVDSGERERLDSEVRRGERRERETSSLLDQPSIVGRENDKNEVLDLLLRERSGEVNEVPVVISIVGMGGLGKTTLSQLIYNDEDVKGHFHTRMWVCVSENFDVKKITKSIIESATGSSCDPLDLDQLQHRLREILHAKRFLLVLDDIWSEDSEKWDKLRLPFQASALQSRIIITTRSEKVALAMGNTHMYKLAVLSEDDCWLLFSRRALKHRSAEECLELEDIGREIVKKCGGLPLAAKTMGSAMRSRRTRSQWELVLGSQIWNSADILEGILPALLLSYYDLPPTLKQCFTFCSVFPKDWWINRDVIVKLWVAQGFIRSEISGEMEEISKLYFDDLLRRSLLQDAEMDSDGNIFRCKMHDLVHDLAQFVAGSDYSVVEIRKQASLNLNNVRHSFLILSDEVHDEADEVASILHKAHKLRTFLLHSSITRVPYNFFHHLRCLRALDLSRTRLKKLPQSVEQLKHLRYLDLSYTHIEELPEGVSNCRNLQTLRLNACARLCKLPRGMGKMICMRHLELEDTHMLKFLQQGIGRLAELRTLTDFIVGGGDEGCKCGELKNLNHLQGRLQITGLENVRSTDEAREAELYKKQHLHALILDYDSICGLLDEEVKRMEDVLEILQPNTNLKEFEIWNYEGSKLPSWIEDPVFSNLVKVNLMNCWKCKKLPGLGKLPSLKCLIIEGMEEVRYMGDEFSGVDNCNGSGRDVSFPKLEILIFFHMPNWEEWELKGGDGEVMPSLLQLEIRDCPKLKALPHNLPPLLRKLALNITNDGMSSEGPLPVLPNLNHLVIWYSPELTSFPCGWLGQLKALQTLEIYRCPMLGSLPEELQHLTMLRELKITCCPLLVDRCRDGGEDWDNIAHIPCIKICT